jgi:predicted HicB family RNase H-like nuclease
MEYKGYTASVKFDEREEIFHGEVLGIRDVVTFQGKSVGELKESFQGSVDDFLDFCAQRGEGPIKPFSGKFVLRLSPDLHRELFIAAKQAGKSLNAWVVGQLERAQPPKA